MIGTGNPLINNYISEETEVLAAANDSLDTVFSSSSIVSTALKQSGGRRSLGEAEHATIAKGTADQARLAYLIAHCP
jgi:hypothetical protein